jgi:hypothetical protein
MKTLTKKELLRILDQVPDEALIYVNSEETTTQAVCADCYEEGKDQWLSAEPGAETEEDLKRIEERIQAAFPPEQGA